MIYFLMNARRLLPLLELDYDTSVDRNANLENGKECTGYIVIDMKRH